VSDAGKSEFVSRGGVKLAAALDAFDLSVEGCICADLGSHAGGFVDCLLQRGAAKVYAVDTGYGVLDYKLRRDPRVVVCERQNALHFRCPQACQCVTIDVGWTPQRLVLPAVQRMLAPDGRVVTLIKPQYEAPRETLKKGVVPEHALPEILDLCHQDIRDAGWDVLGEIVSPILGHGGNREWLALLARRSAQTA
jgi:23S rRNA (cytidine1920-2'-O)/16S rRNA (cytidine1409-2'-O)-methyltransferase